MCSTSNYTSSSAHPVSFAGYLVFATARRLESLEELSKLPDIHTLALDVCDSTTIRKARDCVSGTTGGKLDILDNNAYVALSLIQLCVSYHPDQFYPCGGIGAPLGY